MRPKRVLEPLLRTFDRAKRAPGVAARLDVPRFPGPSLLVDVMGLADVMALKKPQEGMTRSTTALPLTPSTAVFCFILRKTHRGAQIG
jgi:hypothetical protein